MRCCSDLAVATVKIKTFLRRVCHMYCVIERSLLIGFSLYMVVKSGHGVVPGNFGHADSTLADSENFVRVELLDEGL